MLEEAGQASKSDAGMGMVLCAVAAAGGAGLSACGLAQGMMMITRELKGHLLSLSETAAGRHTVVL